jgi:hypothetical protein
LSRSAKDPPWGGRARDARSFLVGVGYPRAAGLPGRALVEEPPECGGQSWQLPAHLLRAARPAAPILTVQTMARHQIPTPRSSRQ